MPDLPELCEVLLAWKLVEPRLLLVAEVTVNVADALCPGAINRVGVE